MKGKQIDIFANDLEKLRAKVRFEELKEQFLRNNRPFNDDELDGLFTESRENFTWDEYEDWRKKE